MPGKNLIFSGRSIIINAGKSIQRIRSVSDNFQWTCYQRLRGGDVRTHRQSDRRKIEYGKDV